MKHGKEPTWYSSRAGLTKQANPPSLNLLGQPERGELRPHLPRVLTKGHWGDVLELELDKRSRMGQDSGKDRGVEKAETRQRRRYVSVLEPPPTKRERSANGWTRSLSKRSRESLADRMWWRLRLDSFQEGGSGAEVLGGI